MTFERWITSQGCKTIAKKVGVTVGTVYFWKWGSMIPRSYHLKRLVQLSRGKVTHASIYKHFESKQNSK